MQQSPTTSSTLRRVGALGNLRTPPRDARTPSAAMDEQQGTPPRRHSHNTSFKMPGIPSILHAHQEWNSSRQGLTHLWVPPSRHAQVLLGAALGKVCPKGPDCSGARLGNHRERILLSSPVSNGFLCITFLLVQEQGCLIHNPVTSSTNSNHNNNACSADNMM